jgi:hypothetical protein
VARFFAYTLALAWAATPLHAQYTNASLTGRITDPSKALIWTRLDLSGPVQKQHQRRVARVSSLGTSTQT